MSSWRAGNFTVGPNHHQLPSCSHDNIKHISLATGSI